ncbi:MAG: small metal-binding protein SmbP [Methyloglobulus sp.]
MKLTDMNIIGLTTAIILTIASFSVSAVEKHLVEAIKHAEAAVNAGNGKAIAEHAETAKTHAKTADEHLDAGIKSLEGVIEHGKLGHDDLAKRNAEEALTHLNAAQ